MLIRRTPLNSNKMPFGSNTYIFVFISCWLIWGVYVMHGLISNPNLKHGDKQSRTKVEVTGSSAIGNKLWNRLEPEEKTAAHVLGYDETNWNQLYMRLSNLTRAAIISPPSKSKSFDPVPTLRLGKKQTLCSLLGFQVVCRSTVRNEDVPSYPMFAEYYVDGDGKLVLRQTPPRSRPIATSWFRPNPDIVCGGQAGTDKDTACANLGDELGPILLLKLSRSNFIENRYDGMDVVIIGSVLNYMVTNYKATVKRVGSFHNVTVWGTGTKWGNPGVCFDFRAVRGPKTRDVYVKQGCHVPEVYGDPALLFPHLYTPEKLQLPTADICLIPHMDDLYHEFQWWKKMNGTSLNHRFSYLDHYTNSSKVVRLLDIRTPDAAAFIDILATCDIVASSSLHGLILAEAYKITWSWVQLHDKHEADFKYHDFFLSVGIDPGEAKPLRVAAGLGLEKVIDHTMKPKARGPSLYDPIKLLDACPFCDLETVERIKFAIRNAENGVGQNKEGALASQTQIQVSHATGRDRYPDEYLFIKKYLDSHWNSKSDSSVKILSFGSSTGEEAISLATLYFNSKEYSHISLYGVDIDGPTVEKATRNADIIRSKLYSNITFFDGRRADISVHGKYDAILANSVLCFYEHPLKEVLLHFTFDQFEKTFQSLDASLKVGGLFGMVNSNYNIEDTTLAKKYKPIAKCEGNFVPRISRETSSFVTTKGQTMDCVWVKTE